MTEIFYKSEHDKIPIYTKIVIFAIIIILSLILLNRIV